jgi:hypothetical protein
MGGTGAENYWRVPLRAHSIFRRGRAYRDDNNRINIAAGTLDDTSFFKPTANIYCEMKQDWVPLAPDMRRYSHQGE